MKPIILITVYRRFVELTELLDHINSFNHEFSVKPDIVVVWAYPKIGHLYFFRKLIKEGKINHLVLRYKVDQDGFGATTYPESLNIRKGLEFISENYKDQNYYVIGHASDIFVREGIYKWIDTLIKDERAILFFWENGIARENVWHTNFFVVKDDKNYWPPVSTVNDFDTLEVQWGKALANKGLQFYRTHNSRSLKFEQKNYNFPEFCLIPLEEDNSIHCKIVGYKSLWSKIKEFFVKIFRRKNGNN